MRNTADAPLEEMVTALQTEVHELEEQIGTLDRRVEEQQKRLTEQDKAGSLRGQGCTGDLGELVAYARAAGEKRALMTVTQH